MANYGIYCTYEALKEYLNIPAAQTSDNKLLFKFAIQASDKLNAHCHNRYFYPIKQTRYYDYPCGVGLPAYSYQNSGQGFGFSTIPTPPLTYLDNTRLELDDDLLEVLSLTTQNGSQTITSSDYYLMTGDKYNFPPYDNIQLKSDGTVTAFGYSGSTQKSNAVTGYWGYHERWADAWQDSLDTVENNPLTSSGTSITVNDVDGVDLFGFTPRFQYQQLLKIEDEFLFVTGKDAGAANALTVIRGVNGTTAAAVGTLSAITLKAGCQIRGYFTAITLTSGGVVAYNL